MNRIIFRITGHARQRIEQRLQTRPHKIRKLVRKAWKSNYCSSWRKNKIEYQRSFDPNRQDIEYRELMGYLFVFEAVPFPDGNVRAKLITVY